jgi:TRAP-type uncharacterized transport system substrate-binding protein
MTNPINTGLPVQPDPAHSAPVARPNTAAGNHVNAAANSAGTEAVTVSAEAQTRTQLLDAARIAPGINQPAISELRTAVQTNSYNIPAEDLATAIATAIKERHP